MKLKKMPRYLTLALLTSGASIILGFLSFSGMFVLTPALPIAFAAFGLSVVYEYEIYMQNIKSAWNKLFKPYYLKQRLAEQYLLKHFPKEDVPCSNSCQFFEDYKFQLDLLAGLGSCRLDKDGRAKKKHLEKKLRDMEKWFAKMLFSPEITNLNCEYAHDKYVVEVQEWLSRHEKTTEVVKYQRQQKVFSLIALYSTLAGIFMSLGTTYLLVEAFSVIPAIAVIPFAMWPLMIIPMSLIAGAAYGFLTYNAMTDMYINNALRVWFDKLKMYFQKDRFSKLNLLTAVSAACLLTLALLLTICSAGTWWTVVKETRPLFSWMNKLPKFIMGVMNPFITGFSTLIFNIQNTGESLDLIDSAARKVAKELTNIRGFLKQILTSIFRGFRTLKESETPLQLINPFRVFLILTFVPLRIILFLGHLVSIGLTADRVPGVSNFYSALLGIISELFEDLHYFFGHNHHHHHHHHEDKIQQRDLESLLKARLDEHQGHNHDVDVPTRLLKLVFAPVFVLAAVWDFTFSQDDKAPKKRLSFEQAMNKHYGIEEEEPVAVTYSALATSDNWSLVQTIDLIDRFKEKQLQKAMVGSDLARQKIEALTALQTKLRQANTASRDAIKELIDNEKVNPIYAKHRFFAQGNTDTSEFLYTKLCDRVGLVSPAA
jgi:hypothetical protein